MLRVYISLLLFILTFASIPGATFAHGTVERVSEAQSGQLRLFTADAATGQVVAIDLPDGEIVARLTTPPFVMALAPTIDRQHIFAMRGRDTDRDWVTVINTGFDVATGELRPPYVARTLLGSATTTGGIHYGKPSPVKGKDAIFLEGTGVLIVFQNNNFEGYEELDVRRYKLAAPDHYHYLVAGDNLYVGFIANAMVQVLNLESGEEIARIPGCPRLHGMAADSTPSGRLFFSCGSDVLVIGTQGDEANREVGRIAYPESQRIATFMKGKDDIFWGHSEGALAILYRFDAARQPYTLETLPVEAAIRQNVTDDGNLLLVLTRAGVFEIRDGGSGEVIHAINITEPFDKDFHEHTDKAILPEIVSLNGRAYVSLPHEGQIAEIDLAEGKLIRHLEVGGEPTRIVLVPTGGAKE